MHVNLFWVLGVVERGLMAIDDVGPEPVDFRCTLPTRALTVAKWLRLRAFFLATDWTLISLLVLTILPQYPHTVVLHPASAYGLPHLWFFGVLFWACLKTLTVC